MKESNYKHICKQSAIASQCTLRAGNVLVIQNINWKCQILMSFSLNKKHICRLSNVLQSTIIEGEIRQKIRRKSNFSTDGSLIDYNDVLWVQTVRLSTRSFTFDDHLFLLFIQIIYCCCQYWLNVFLYKLLLVLTKILNVFAVCLVIYKNK